MNNNTRESVLNTLQKYVGQTIYIDGQPTVLNSAEWLSKYVLKINEKIIDVDVVEFECGDIYLYELDKSQDNYFEENIENEVIISFNK